MLPPIKFNARGKRKNEPYESTRICHWFGNICINIIDNNNSL